MNAFSGFPLWRIFRSIDDRIILLSDPLQYRVVQLNVAPEIEVFDRLLNTLISFFFPCDIFLTAYEICT